MTTDENIELAETFRVSFGALSNLLNDPPYNFGFHMSRENHYHWHLEVYPKLTTWAGFEKSTDMYINIVSPEEAALNIRKFAAKEYKKIG